MNRRVLFALALVSAPPLVAAERYVSQSSTPTAVETVNWTTGVSYTYDGSGNIRQIGEDRFAYDRVGRVVQAQTNGLTRVYQYDAFGNRIACAHEPGKPLQGDCQFGMAVDPETNRVQGIRYDGSGNVETFQGHTYTYDASDMPVRDAGVGPAREFIYTADDERIATTTGSTWNWTLRDLNGKVLRELTSGAGQSGAGSGSWSWKRDYVYRDGLLLASTHLADGLQVLYHYHLDHLGTPRRITDRHDRTVGFHDYFAFGPEISGGLTELFPARLQYTGHERDKTGGGEGPDTLDYMHARYYSPMLGRFLTVDPVIDVRVALQYPQAWNRYAYVRNNPLRWTDPTGKVISYDEEFKRRVRTDPEFRKAFQAWKRSPSGAAQWRTMARDTNTVYKLGVGKVVEMTGPLKVEEADGRTLPVVGPRNENKAGKLDMPVVTMTINVDYIKSTHTNVPEMIPAALAKTLFHEVLHGLDIGSGTRSARQAWKAEELLGKGIEPRMQLFERELNKILPPPDWD